MIQLRNVSKSFVSPDGGRLEVLRAIDCAIDAGDFVAIVGPSGSGKSTLMHILGLLDRPDIGDYELAGEQTADIDDDGLALVRNRRIGFVFQQFHLLPRTTALENAALPLLYARDGAASDRPAMEALCRVGLHDRLSHYPSQLSGGQQQRVAIARALVNDPTLILADEPTGNLDADTTTEILSLFAELNSDGRTIVVITHDAAVARHCRRVLALRDGRLVEEQAS